jgi:3-hydroxybutyryl-CoA dehydrogenase
MEIKKIGIIGAGAMGTGIGQVAASNGCSVIFYDAYAPSLVKSKQSLNEVMDKLVAKNKLNRSKADELLTYVLGHMK